MTDNENEGVNSDVDQDLFWTSIRRALEAGFAGEIVIHSDLVESLLDCEVPEESDRPRSDCTDDDYAPQKRIAEVVIWRISFLRASSYGALQTPESDAEAAVSAYKRRWAKAPQTITFDYWIWMLSYLPELIQNPHFHAMSVADKRLNEVLNLNLKQIYQARIEALRPRTIA